jgi:hypothetical protein
MICKLFSFLTSWHESRTVLLFRTEVKIKLKYINKTNCEINGIIIFKNQKMEDSHKELELSAKPFIIQKIWQVQLYTNKFKNKILVHYYIMNNLMTICSTQFINFCPRPQCVVITIR